MTFVSLFAGVGGFDQGLEAAGHECIGQCEIDPHARAVLETHWPNVPKHDDVTTLTGDHFGPAEIVTFGSPCQDLSVAGKRAGLGGERSGLFMEAVRYIRDVLEATNGRLPRLALWENVPGAFSSNDGRDFAAVLEALVGGEVRRPADGWAGAGVAFGPLGSVEWRVLDSQHFGVAQRRRRVFLVYRPGSERAGAVLLEPEGVRGDPPAGREAGEGVTGPLEARTRGGGFPGTDGAVSGHVVPVAFRWKSASGAGLSEEETSPALEAATPPHAIAFAMRGRNGGAQPEISGDTVNTLRGSAGGSSRDMVAFAQNQRDEVRVLPGVVGALAAEPGAKQQTYLSTGYAVRRLTPRECERLQGFPDDHTRHRPDGSEIADTHRYRMLGNAVTVNVAEWIGRRLAELA